MPTSSAAVRSMVLPPSNSLSLPSHEYPHFAAPGSTEFKHTISTKDQAPPTDVGGGVITNRRGVIPSLEQNKARKAGEYSSSSGLLSQSFHSSGVSGNIMGELPITLEPSMPPVGLAHNSRMASESPSANAEAFQGMLASQDDTSLQVNREALGGSRYSVPDSESGHIGPSMKSLSHPNLSSIPPRAVPRGTSMSQAVPSQAPPVPFPANLGGFSLSSMVGHFTSPHHPHLQAQPLSMNPAAAGGLMHGLGLTVGSNPAGQQPSSIAIAQTLSLSNPPQPMPAGLLAGTNPSISIMNPVSSLSMPPGGGGGGSRSPNLPPTSLPMPLTHPIATNLQNPNLPLIQGMPNMYSYPYAATLPTQPATSSPAGFPPHSLMPPGYSQYLPPSLYSNSPQQPR